MATDPHRSPEGDTVAHRIKITRAYTLPHSREERGRIETEPHTYDPDDWRTPVEWATDVLNDSGCTRHNSGNQFITEEPKITDSSRGEEMTATAVLTGFADGEWVLVYDALNN